MKKFYVAAAILLCIAAFDLSGEPAACTATNLRCEYLVRPLGIDVNPRLSWNITDNRVGAIQHAFRVMVGTDSLLVAAGRPDAWDSGKRNEASVIIRYEGKNLKPFTKYYWRLTVWDKDNNESQPAWSAFETGMRTVSNWKGSWISDDKGEEVKEAPYFRKEFTISKKVKTARAYIAAGGLYELYLNGEKTGNHRLDPMYTRFDRRTLYVTWDITNSLHQGINAAGVVLGNGWYNHQSTAVWYFERAPWRNRPTFCMDIRIIYDDGSEETIVTDNGWKTSSGELIFNSIYTGEHHDARLAQPGWNRAGFDDRKWKNTVYRAAPSTNIVSQQLHPVRNVEKVAAQAVRKINDTLWVFDLGRNIAGVSQFNVSAPEGTAFRLKHSERTGSDGRADISNIVVHYRPKDDLDPFQTDIFITKGEGVETFMPLFNYKGFQYVEVSSSKPVELTTASLCGWFMHSDVPPAGEVVTSNPMLNKLWRATNNSYLSNLFGYPTDCPQREKNGWTGDGHTASELGLYNFDGITVYEKWIADHRDEQQPNGVLPAIIPTSGWGYHWANGPDWTSTIAIIPWNIYMFYGDASLLSDSYENIRSYVDYITRISSGGLTTWGLGDWIPVKSETPVELTSSVFYYTDARILAKAAELFGKRDDQAKYSALASEIKDAINKKYLDREKAVYGEGNQTAMSFPLYAGVVPEDMRARVAENLAKRVIADNTHLDVGLLGSKSILNALSDNGYADLAYKLVSQETFPSWGWWIVNGATTLYENWPIDAKSDISLNHIMFGEPGAWFYKALGGINPDPQNPGFRNTLLKPCFVAGLESASASHTGPYGEIISKWNRKGKMVTYSVTIPANSSADLFIPEGYSIKKQPLDVPNETYGIEARSALKYHLQAGSYIFELKQIF